MRKNLLLTSLLTLAAAFGVAQETTKWPITLTTADGLPGDKVVLNYTYQSPVYNLETETKVLRFTVVSTNTVDVITEMSDDGLGSGWGPGFPFFTMSEFRIYDGSGKQLEYVASCNALASNDGGGLDALSDNNEGTFLHTVYSYGEAKPNAYHYVEFELPEAVKSFSFNWNTRSGYHKNLITYMGITPGTEYLPYPEQQFELGEQVTTLEGLAEEGGLFVIRSNANDFVLTNDNDTYGFERTYKGKSFLISPFGAAETANAAALVYLTPDAAVENGYKITWLNNGRHFIAPERVGNGEYLLANWTNDILNAATVAFVPCDTVDGAFTMKSTTSDKTEYLLAYGDIGRMYYVKNDGSVSDMTKGGDGHGCNTYNFNIYKASINGSAITAELQVAINEAQARLDAVGLHPEDEGEFDALTEAIAKANAHIANPEVSASEVIASKRELNMLTAAYAAVTIWAYVDSIDNISAAIDAEEIVVASAPDWIEGAYNYEAYQGLLLASDDAQVVIDNYQSLAEIDEAIAAILKAVDLFWASKITNVKSLPFRVGNDEDGLPGTKESYGGYRWESPLYNLTEEVEAIRITIFKTNGGAYSIVYNNGDIMFPTWGEVEFYDGANRKINLKAENFEMPSVYNGDGGGVAALCDGNIHSYCHGSWEPGQAPEYDEDPTYQYLEITFPEPISSFKYVQYGRDNSYNTPIDFIIGEGGVSYTPEDIVLPDPYNTELGEQITDVSQITDDGFYALVGLLNCAPEGDGTGNEKYYTSNKVHGTKIGAPGLFSIRKTGAEDGSFYIQSIEDGKYWSSEIAENGWGGGNITTSKDIAGKFIIEPMPREQYGKDTSYENTFVIYQYNDTVMRDTDEDDVAESVPYIVVQEWGGNTGYFSVTDLGKNDWDGEGEWKIFKATMKDPHLYWLNSVYAAASEMKLQVSPDPGYYSVEAAGGYADALVKAQAAIESGNDAIAKEAIVEIEATIAQAATATTNPVVEGIYVFESTDDRFFPNQGKYKAMCTYYNNFEEESPMCTSKYSLYWGDAPLDFKNAHVRYKFELISAKDCEAIQIMVEDGTLAAEDAANAYFIKSVEAGEYVYEADAVSQDIGLSVEPETPYIVRTQGMYKFDFWNPNDGYFSLHMEDHGGGGGDGGDIVYWRGSDTPSQWRLRLISKTTSIDDIVVAEGDEVVSVTYYTPAGAKVPAPVQGVTIVKTVYANGVVKSEKVFTK